MQLINYDLYDLYAFIVFFRSNPQKFPEYKDVVKQIINYINIQQNGEIKPNAIRKIIKSHLNYDDIILSWALVDNQYTANVSIIKNESYYNILTSVLNEMISSYTDTQRFYLLCDAVHNIPLLLADTKRPQKVIKTAIKDYRKNYNKTFLVNELKII